jgi:hypothetical protein
VDLLTQGVRVYIKPARGPPIRSMTGPTFYLTTPSIASTPAHTRARVPENHVVTQSECNKQCAEALTDHWFWLEPQTC